MHILGCDPGAHGGLALLVDGKLQDTWLMPKMLVQRNGRKRWEINGAELGELLREIAPDHLFIEQVGGMPGQGASASFNFGRAAAAPEYMCCALGVPVTLVPPATWKRRCGCMGGKYAAVGQASRLFPSHVSHWTGKKFTQDEREGRAEATLIAWYGWLALGGRAEQTNEESADVFG